MSDPGSRGSLEAFEKLKVKHKKQVDLLQTRVETPGKDKSTLEERNKFLQEKNKKLTKDHKGNSLDLLFVVEWLISPSSFCVSTYIHLVHTELKKLLITKEELVTDLANIMYRHTNAVEKLSKIKADADKQLI